MMNLTLRQIVYGSPEHQATVALRYEILRKPLGLEFTPEQLQSEESDYHLACYHGEDLIGCLILTPRDDTTVKMRQLAVADDARGKGVGRALVEFSEYFARQHGFSKITMHARETAVPFYEKLGYSRVGERFQEVTLPHWKMQKRL